MVPSSWLSDTSRRTFPWMRPGSTCRGFRWTFPRLRVDQLMELSWKFLIPVAFLNLIAIGLWAVLS